MGADGGHFDPWHPARPIQAVAPCRSGELIRHRPSWQDLSCPALRIRESPNQNTILPTGIPERLLVLDTANDRFRPYCGFPDATALARRRVYSADQSSFEERHLAAPRWQSGDLVFIWRCAAAINTATRDETNGIDASPGPVGLPLRQTAPSSRSPTRVPGSRDPHASTRPGDRFYEQRIVRNLQPSHKQAAGKCVAK